MSFILFLISVFVIETCTVVDVDCKTINICNCQGAIHFTESSWIKWKEKKPIRHEYYYWSGYAIYRVLRAVKILQTYLPHGYFYSQNKIVLISSPCTISLYTVSLGLRTLIWYEDVHNMHPDLEMIEPRGDGKVITCTWPRDTFNG